ncbi:uncharacterized protein LOC108222856 isoform X1 [Daucus carota subsp. sativus]
MDLGSLVGLKPWLSSVISRPLLFRLKKLNNMLNAFKAYKACVPIAWSPNLYITLVRGIPGTRKLHRRTLEALRLRKCNRTVMRWNTPTVRGMLQQVKRLVVIETEEMYKARKQKIADHQAIRPPLVVNHFPKPANGSSQQSM